MPVRKYHRETSEVSCCLKYVVFGFNVLFWMIGLGVLAIGLWAWKEKDIFNNLSKTSYILLDPAFILICIGAVTYVIAFTGSVGALRENTCLLATYAIFLSILLILEVGLGTLAFVFKDKGWIKDQATEGLRAFIIYYREDPDQQNLIDWIQEDWLQCCGIEGPKDWDSNNYFNCSSRAVGSREACGVPFSCCKRKPHEIIKNKQCGYDVRKEGYPAERHIFERGCLRAGEDWLEGHLFPVAGACVSIMVVQVLSNLNIFLLILVSGVESAVPYFSSFKYILTLKWLVLDFVFMKVHSLHIIFKESYSIQFLKSRPKKLRRLSDSTSHSSVNWLVVCAFI